MTWLQTHSCRALDLASPDPADVRLEDIAHALSRICRYNGHTSRHYSVAEHCCHVADYLEQRAIENGHEDVAAHIALAGLLHDASEAYVGDLTYPLQQALGPAVRAELRAAHERVWLAIRAALGVPPAVNIHAPAVKWVDRTILLDERDALMGPSPRSWDVPGEPLGVAVQGWAPDVARTEWLSRFERLMGEVRCG